MDIRPGAVPLGGFDRATVLARVKAAAEAADARKREIRADAGKALASPRLSASETAKSQARQKVQQIRERLNILKKLYGANPKEMARALAQVFKELKAAVKAYKAAGGEELSMSGEVARTAVADPEAAPADTSQGDASADPAAPAEDKPAPVSGADGRSLYAAVVDEVRTAIGEDGLAFVKEVRGLTRKIVELLDAARGQASIRKPDKETDEAFKDADESLKALNKDMADMESDIHMAVPSAGMRLSVAA